MNTTITVTAFEALAHVHANHVERIKAHVEAMRPGAVVTFGLARPHGVATTDGGTFFTGIREGDHVVVTDFHQYASGGASRSVQILDGDAAHLSVNGGMTLTPVDPALWTEEEALAAQRAATKGASEQMEKALCSANGLLGAPAGDEAACTALRRAHDLRNYAFACGILAGYIKGLRIGDGYYVRHALDAQR